MEEKKNTEEIETKCRAKHIMEEFVTVGGKKLRKGYTTGTCAAAASKAAVSMLVSGKIIQEIDIDTPAGIKLKLPVSDAHLDYKFAECSIVKDGGDDPDITSGLKVFSRVELIEDNEDNQVIVKAGEGIGRVTLPGLKVEVGKPAINPAPMKMIHNSVREVLPHDKGVIVTLSVPGGQEIAKKTYNPKLGIVGGISIIGTKGIVEPMSEEAWKEALALELNVLRNKGYKTCVFVFGNYGEEFAISKLGIEKERIIKISNFVGFMLDKAVEYGIRNILFVGHIGKLIKVAAGIFHTHSRVADARMEILTAYGALEGASIEVVRKIYSCKTTGEAISIIESNGLNRIYERISCNVSKRCIEYTYGKINVGTVLFNEDNNLLFIDKEANEIISDLNEMASELKPLRT